MPAKDRDFITKQSFQYKKFCKRSAILKGDGGKQFFWMFARAYFLH